MRHDAPVRRPAPRAAVTWIVAAHAACVLGLHLAVRRLDAPWAGELAFGASALREGRWWTPLTHVLVDEVAFAWVGGLVALWACGRAVEERVGPWRLARFLLVAALVACAVHVAGTALDPQLRLAEDLVVGMSAPATACAVYAWRRDARHEMWAGSLVGLLPVRVVAGTWLAAVLMAVVGIFDVPQFGVWAHAGAAAWGFAAARVATAAPGTSWLARLRPARAAPARGDDGDNERASVQARVDALLDKISREGIASLSDAERDFLKRASKRY